MCKIRKVAATVLVAGGLVTLGGCKFDGDFFDSALLGVAGALDMMQSQSEREPASSPNQDTLATRQREQAEFAEALAEVLWRSLANDAEKRQEVSR